MNQSSHSRTGAKNFPKLSLVIPCYNEAERLEKLFGPLSDFVKKWKGPLEVLIIDDGSTDHTVEAIRQQPLFRELESAGKARIISYHPNRGKGYALKTGVMEATGDYILTLDADMSMKPGQLLRWMEMNGGRLPENEVWIASRELKDSATEGDQSRRLAGNIFNRIVRILTPLDLKDTQCGFKLYPAPIAKQLFTRMKVHGWAHDVELLYRARLKGIALREMPIQWFQEPGSKVSVLRDALKMLWQVLMVTILLKWQFFVTDPLRSLLRKDEKPDTKDGRASIFRLFYFLSLAFLLFYMPYISKDYGITGDEDVQYIYGEHLYDYFASGGSNDTAQNCCPDLGANAPQNLHFYGGSFDLLASTVHHTLGLKGDPFRTRHVLNALFGFLALLFAAKLAKMYGGYGAGFLTILLLVLTPRFFGHSMNNPKDIPFAAAYIMSIYFLLKSIRQFPRPRISSLIGLTLGIALAISIRIGGLMLIGFTGMIGLWEVFANPELRKNFIHDFKHYLKIILGVSLLGYALGILFWPYAHLDPIGNPLKALGLMEQFNVGVRVLFEGNYIMSTEVPWYYEPKFMLLTLPLALMTGLILLPLAFLQKEYNKRQLLMLLFTVIFPLAYAIYKSSPLYDGMRHFLFVVPILAVLSALSWKALINKMPNRIAKGIVGLLLAVLLFLPLRWMIKYHPMEATYFNEISGGVAKNFGDYETDYWFNALKPAVDWLEEEELKNRKDTVLIIHNVSYIIRHMLQEEGIPAIDRWGRYNNAANWSNRQNNRRWSEWDYAIFTPRFLDTEILKNEWPPHNTVYTVDVEGKAMAAVIKRPSKKDSEGYEALQSGDYDQAIASFKEYLKADPDDPVVLYYLGRAYLQAGRYDDAARYLERSMNLRKIPIDEEQELLLARALLQSGQLEKGLAFISERIKKYESRFNSIGRSGVLNEYQRGMAAYQRAQRSGADENELRKLSNKLSGPSRSVQEYIGLARKLNSYYALGANAWQAQGKPQRAGEWKKKAGQYAKLIK